MFARRKLALALAAFALAGIGAEQLSAPPSRLVFLSVGQGDCALFQHGGRNIVIDTGWTDSRAMTGDLQRRRVRRIDLLLLTHPDRDHTGGTQAILDRFDVRRIGIPAHFREHPALLEDIAEWRAADRVVWIERGAALQLGSATLEFDYAEWSGSLKDDNNGSLWVRIQAGAASALLTGDAEISAENEVLARRDWSAQVFKAGHHGSAQSTGDALLAEVDPAAVVFSCGARNPYGHPTPEAMGRARASGAQIYRTDQQGAVTFRVTPQGFAFQD